MIALLFIGIFLSSVNGQTLVGKVSVVASDGDSAVYSFNENYVSGLEVDVNVTVVDEVGDEVVSPVTLVVNVSCELSPAGNGYADVTFTSVQHTLPTQTNTTVPFSILSAGRQTQVVCWGEADSTDPTAPVFTKDTSVGDTGQLSIRPAGTVSVCESLMVVSMSGSAGDTMLIELSEAVENGNATVNCSSDVTGVVEPIRVEFDLALLLSGQHRTEVSYVVTALGNPVTVSCYAESQPEAGVDNLQFYQENSTGLESTFVQESVSVEIVPLLQQLRTTEMTAFLVLSERATATVEFQCDVFVSEDLDQARDLLDINGCVGDALLPGESSTVSSVFTTDVDLETVSATHAPPANASDSDWLLQDSVIVFEESEYFKPLSLYRQADNLYTQAFRPEVVTVRCCSTGVPGSDLYTNQSATFAVVVYLDSNHTVNWDEATDPTNRTVETEIINPAYVEVAPCPCDVTEGSCDVGCCCDESCTEADKETFQCIPGIQGGEENDETPRHLCSAEYFNQPDWAPIMCVHDENSAFLGFFRQPEPAIRSRDNFTDKISQYAEDFSYKQPRTPFPLEPDADQVGYKEGLSMKTGVQQQRVSEELTIGPNYRLVLPGRSTSGQCVYSEPVAFLKDSAESCVWEMTEALCGLTSPLNALNYALPSDDGVPGCRKGLLLLSEQSLTEVAFTNVDYHCADQEYVERHYLRSSATVTQSLPDDQVKLFDSELPNNGEDCRFDDLTGAYICEDLTVGEDTNPPTEPLPARCGWDNGYTAAPSPALDVAAEMCVDSVLEVRYNFTWNGPRLVQLNATVILGNVSLQQEFTDAVSNTTLVTTQLTQLSHVEWHHQINESLYPDYAAQNDDPETDNASIIVPRTSDVYKRSGKIGYELDLPVWSGIAAYNTTENQFLYVDTNLSSQLSLWKPGVDSLCEGAQREYVTFRQSGLGSCLLRLGLQQLLDCDHLRRLVLNKQDSMMLSNYVGLSGDPDPANLEEDWVQILREDLSGIMPELDPNATAPVDPEVNINNTYRENLVGVCRNIPSHINVDVMYAQVGLNNGIPLHQIIGAKIGYQLTTWSLYCTAADGAGCLGNTTWLEEVAAGKEFVQSFLLSSSVNFIEGPPRAPERKTRYAVDTSYDYFLCKYDTCWTEAFYPFTAGFEGDSYQYTLAVSLASLVFLIGLFTVSKPWW